MNWSKLKITGATPHPGDWHIYLDDHKIEGITSLELILDVDSVPTARIEMMPGSIQVEGAALLELIARVKAKEDAS